MTVVTGVVPKVIFASKTMPSKRSVACRTARGRSAVAMVVEGAAASARRVLIVLRGRSVSAPLRAAVTTAVAMVRLAPQMGVVCQSVAAKSAAATVAGMTVELATQTWHVRQTNVSAHMTPAMMPAVANRNYA